VRDGLKFEILYISVILEIKKTIEEKQLHWKEEITLICRFKIVKRWGMDWSLRFENFNNSRN